MTHLKLIISLILFSTQTAFAQENNTVDIKKKLFEADSVLFVSHIEIAGSTNMFTDSTREIVLLQPLLIGQKLNEAVLLKKIMLSKSHLNTLGNILSKPFTESISSQAGCFTSHHSIILIKYQKISFIDLSFRCSHFETSADLKGLYFLDRLKWEQLEALFKTVGLSLDEDE